IARQHGCESAARKRFVHPFLDGKRSPDVRPHRLARGRAPLDIEDVDRKTEIQGEPRLSADQGGDAAVDRVLERVGVSGFPYWSERIDEEAERARATWTLLAATFELLQRRPPQPIVPTGEEQVGGAGGGR